MCPLGVLWQKLASSAFFGQWAPIWIRSLLRVQIPENGCNYAQHKRKYPQNGRKYPHNERKSKSCNIGTLQGRVHEMSVFWGTSTFWIIGQPSCIFSVTQICVTMEGPGDFRVSEAPARAPSSHHQTGLSSITPRFAIAPNGEITLWPSSKASLVYNMLGHMGEIVGCTSKALD